MKAIRYRLEFLLIKLLLFLVGIPPQSFVVKLGSGFGLLLYYLGVRKSVVGKNLEIAFGHRLNDDELTDLAKKTYRNAGMVFFEVLRMDSIPSNQIAERIEIVDADILKTAVAEGKGAVIAGNHFGNFELLSAGISALGIPYYEYTGKQKNQLVDETINNTRRRFGIITISKSKTATFQMMKILKDGNMLAMAGDLNVPHDNLFVEFFGKKAAVGQGLTAFARMKRTPLIFAWCVRTGPFQYRGRFKRLDYDTTEDEKKDREKMAQLISSELEEKIRRHPEQYYWFNQRWKTRPLDENSEDVY